MRALPSQISYVAVLLAVASLAKHAIAQQHYELRSRFFKESPQAWANYNKLARALQGEYWASAESVSGQEKSLVSKVHYEIKQADECYWFLEEHLIANGKKNQDATLRVRNRSYGFELRRSAPTSQWVVSNLGQELWGKATVDTPRWWINSLASFAYTFSGLPDLGPVSQEHGFTVKSASPMKVKGMELAKLEFTCNSNDASPFKSLVGEGWVLFDPNALWVIREYRVKKRWATPDGEPTDGFESGAYAYEEIDGKFPILKKKTIHREIPAWGKDIMFTYDFSLRQARIPESDFTLSAFGFSEPPGLKAPTPWFVWIGLAGLLCVVLALAARWLRRRA